MRRYFPLIRRACAWMTIYRLEIELQAQNDALAECETSDDPDERDLRDIVAATRRITRRELAAARQRYHDLLPPGDRRTWRIA